MSVRTWESEEYHSFWRRSNRAYLDRMERRLLDRLLAPGRWFIDLGGGYGRLMDLYRDRCPNVVISDYSISMLEDANRRLVREGIRNVRLVAADVNRMPFRPGVFDSAMMIRLIHHLQDPEPALREGVLRLRIPEQAQPELPHQGRPRPHEAARLEFPGAPRSRTPILEFSPAGHGGHRNRRIHRRPEVRRRTFLEPEAAHVARPEAGGRRFGAGPSHGPLGPHPSDLSQAGAEGGRPGTRRVRFTARFDV
jgi:hypothetical protein